MLRMDSPDRLTALRRLLAEGNLSTQDELREGLKALKFKVTQSTVSRDLRRLGAVRAIETDGTIVYRLPEEPQLTLAQSNGIAGLVLDIQTNGVMIVISTVVGSASLVARHLDQVRPGEILGTIAGDDTIFVAPASIKNIPQVIKAIQASFSSDD